MDTAYLGYWVPLYNYDPWSPHPLIDWERVDAERKLFEEQRQRQTPQAGGDAA